VVLSCGWRGGRKGKSNLGHHGYRSGASSPGQRPAHDKGSYVMIRTTIISVIVSFVVVGAWTVNLVTYHPAADLNPLAPFGTNVDWK
jgi:hypothetical protein